MHQPRLKCARALAGAAVVVVLGPAMLSASQAPVIDSYTPSTTSVLPGDSITLQVEAHDPDCASPPCDDTAGCGEYIRADLTGWTATDSLGVSKGTFTTEDNGVSGSPYSASAEWQAPLAEGTYSLTVYVADSATGFFCGGPRGSIETTLDVLVTTVINEPPVIDSLSARRTLLFPGETTALTCVASDLDSDPLTYTWETDIGSVASGGGGSATFTAIEPGIAAVICTATDPSGGFGQKSIGISVTGARAEKAIGAGLIAPQRLAIDSFGDIYVVDGSGGGISVVNLESGEPVYKLALNGATSVAVDWSDRLLLGGTLGADVRDRAGNLIRSLDPGGYLGEVSDVAVDFANLLYGVLYEGVGRVVLFDAAGDVAGSFGSTGDAPEQFKSPRGLAVTPGGDWAVADSGRGLIKVFTPTGALTSSFGGLGGGAGKFVALDDVAVDGDGVFYASDSFQSWLQSFNPDGTPRETLGTFGADVGQFRTPTGVLPVGGQNRLVAASLNTSNLHVFSTSNEPLSQPPGGPVGVLSAATADFPATAVGGESAPIGLTLSNTGETPLGVRALSVVGAFRASHECGLFVDPGVSCTVSVRFAPTEPGSQVGSLVIDSSDPSATLEISLSGGGFVPASASLSKNSWGFPDQEVGTLSEPYRFFLTNTGTVPLEIFEITATEQYLQSNTCGTSVVGGGSCAIDVSFAPELAADFIYGTLTVVSGALDSPHTVALDGRGVIYTPTISIADGQIEEGDGPPTAPAVVELQVTLDTAIFEPVTVDYTTVADTGLAGEDFVAATGTLTLDPGQTSATIAVEVVGDLVLEPDEEFLTVELANPVNADLGTAVATATILDDELCPGANLLINGGAEEGDLTGWTPVRGFDWEVRFEQPDPYAGSAYFAAGSGMSAELAQDVDLAAFAEGVDLGSQWFAFGGWVRTADGDTARVIIEYLDSTQTFVIDGFDTGELSSTAEWTRVEDLRAAPPDARWLRVRLIGDTLLEDGTDAYFDRIAVRSLRVPTLVVDDAMDYEGDTAVAADSDTPSRSLLFAVRLACPYWRRVDVDYASADATAVEFEDYLANFGRVSLRPGDVAAGISVDLLGDEVDEGHEAMLMRLSNAQPAEIALVDAEGLGIIINDDFCQKSAGWWSRRQAAWPAAELVLGGELYGQTDLGLFLDYGGSDVPTRLARQMVAAHFNLLIGSDPSILPVVEAAEAFLAIHPPGSGDELDAAETFEGRALRKDLDDYQKHACRTR